MARDVFAYPTSIKVLQATVAQAAVRMDEPELIRAAQRGDQRAFEQLVRLYDQNVLRLAMNLLRSPEDANDIYQEAFLRVYKTYACIHSGSTAAFIPGLVPDHVRRICVWMLCTQAARAARRKIPWWRTSEGFLDPAWIRWKSLVPMVIRSASS